MKIVNISVNNLELNYINLFIDHILYMDIVIISKCV